MSASFFVFRSSQPQARQLTGRMRYYMTEADTGVGSEAEVGGEVGVAAGELAPPAEPEGNAGARSEAGDLADFFARRDGVSRAVALETMLRRALYPHARVLRLLLLVLDPDYFSADRDYVVSLGALRRRRDLGAETEAFLDHLENRRFPRRVLRLRISARRAHALVREWARG